jgi:ketosteroid isomerase-like protein
VASGDRGLLADIPDRGRRAERRRAAGVAVPTNEELVRRGTAAFNDRDIDGFLETCDPEIEFTTRIMELEGSGPYRGHDDVRRWWDEVFAVFPDFRIEADQVRDLGRVTVTRLLQSGQGAGSSAPAERVSWQVMEWRNGRCIWMRIFQNEAEALEAAEHRR